MKNKDYLHKEFPKTCHPKDFFGQVKRTVNGKAISDSEIQLIVETIKAKLELNSYDFLFDLGCGNSALSSMLFKNIGGYLGIDFSEYLVKIAKENFEKPGFKIELAEGVEYLQKIKINKKVTKVLCYGVFSYFNSYDANIILSQIKLKFPNVRKILIGNIPDKNRAQNFYYKNINHKDQLDDNTTNIGKWWSLNEFKLMANQNKYNFDYYIMPNSFYASHYRYDVVLT
jgi:cyclopropane fatty-acyl-phospholipid synthase-like methyltransferase